MALSSANRSPLNAAKRSSTAARDRVPRPVDHAEARARAHSHREGSRRGDFRPDIDIDAAIDLLYAPIYYRLQIGTGALTDEYADEILQHAVQGLSSNARKFPGEARRRRR